jgi:hypothetical protein
MSALAGNSAPYLVHPTFRLRLTVDRRVVGVAGAPADAPRELSGADGDNGSDRSDQRLTRAIGQTNTAHTIIKSSGECRNRP